MVLCDVCPEAIQRGQLNALREDVDNLRSLTQSLIQSVVYEGDLYSTATTCDGEVRFVKIDTWDGIGGELADDFENHFDF